MAAATHSILGGITSDRSAAMYRKVLTEAEEILREANEFIPDASVSWST